MAIVAKSGVPRVLPGERAGAARWRRPVLPALGLRYLVIVLGLAFALFPVWFLVTASLRPGQTLFSTTLAGSLWPSSLTLENYRYILIQTQFPIWIRNSTYIALFSSLATLALATPAASAYSHFRFRTRSALLTVLLALQAFPPVLALVPIYPLLQRLSLLNHGGLILAYSSGALVFSIWNMKGYFDTLPTEFVDAALIDGASRTQAFLRVILPLARPVLAVTAMFGFMSGWNEFIVAQTILNRSELFTAPVGLVGMQVDRSIPWGYFAAGSLIVSVPVMLFFLLVQRNLVSGLATGGVKG